MSESRWGASIEAYAAEEFRVLCRICLPIFHVKSDGPQENKSIADTARKSRKSGRVETEIQTRWSLVFPGAGKSGRDVEFSFTWSTFFVALAIDCKATLKSPLHSFSAFHHVDEYSEHDFSASRLFDANAVPTTKPEVHDTNVMEAIPTLATY